MDKTDIDMVDIKAARASKRKELIEDLVKTFHEKGSKDTLFSLRMSSLIIEYLIDRQKGVDRPRIEKDSSREKQKDWEFLFWSILKYIHWSARTDEEKDFIVARFLERIVAIGTHPFHVALFQQETKEPGKVFNVSAVSPAVPAQAQP